MNPLLIILIASFPLILFTGLLVYANPPNIRLSEPPPKLYIVAPFCKNTNKYRGVASILIVRCCVPSPSYEPTIISDTNKLLMLLIIFKWL